MFKKGDIIAYKYKILDVELKSREFLIKNLSNGKEALINEKDFFESYFQEKASISDIKIGKTCFLVYSQYNISEFRVTGFLYIYETSDNKKYTAIVPQKDANGIVGVGVCGWNIKLDDPNLFILKRETPFSEEQVKQEENNFLSILKIKGEREINRFNLLKDLPNGLTSIEVDEILEKDREKRFQESIKTYQEDNLEKIKVKEIFGIEKDTRKTINRNPNIKLSDYISDIKEITEDGLTIEKIEEILSKNNTVKERILYKYTSQITLHLMTDEKFKKGFKEDNLIFNENGTLGIKYRGIDTKKKRDIYLKLIKLGGWKLVSNSNEWFITKSKIFTEKEEGLKILNEYRTIINRVDKDLFGGFLQAQVSSIPMVGLVANLTLNINFIYKENQDILIKQILGLDEEGIIKLESDLIQQEELKRIENQKKLDEYKKKDTDELIEIEKTIKDIIKLFSLKEVKVGDFGQNFIGFGKYGETYSIFWYKRKGKQFFRKNIPYLKMDTLKEFEKIKELGIEKYIKLIRNDYRYENIKFKNIKNGLLTQDKALEYIKNKTLYKIYED